MLIYRSTEQFIKKMMFFGYFFYKKIQFTIHHYIFKPLQRIGYE